MAKVRPKEALASYERIMESLKKRIYKPIYLLMGDESYFIDQVSNYIAANVLTEAEKSFNQTIMYGEDVTPQMVTDVARRFPMMSNQQVVIVKEAQNMGKIEGLESYAKSPLNSTILVLCYKNKTLDKRKSLYKQISQVGEVLETVRLYDNEVAGWITSYLKSKKCAIEPNAAAILADSLGSDLSKIVNELDKLMVLLPQGTTTITADHIERNIGISKEYNTFEFNNAVTKLEVLKVNRIINHFEGNPKDYPIILTLNSLYQHFLKLFTYHMLKAKYRGAAIPDTEIRGVMKIEPYFKGEYDAASKRFSPTKVAEVLSLIREFDMRSKGWNNVSTSNGDLLRELIYRIMH
jgi:DNA polymerase-3 subunit delta